MNPAQIEDEKRFNRLAGIAAIIGVLALLLSMVLPSNLTGIENVELLERFDALNGDIVVQAVFQAIAYLLFAPPLLALFRSVLARSEAVRPGLRSIVVAAPLFLAVASVLIWFAYDAASTTFNAASFDLAPAQPAPDGVAGEFWSAVDEGLDDHREQLADDAFADEVTAQIALGARLAGGLGLAFVIVYMSLHAMRVGLLTRFFGTLGMALGIGTVLFGPPMLLIFMLILGLLLARWWPGTLPPAWDAGAAVPWPTPGKPGDAEPTEAELASPDDFEGSAREVDADEVIGSNGTSQKRKKKKR